MFNLLALALSTLRDKRAALRWMGVSSFLHCDTSPGEQLYTHTHLSCASYVRGELLRPLMFGNSEALLTNLHVRLDAHHAISQDLDLSTDWASTFHARVETSVKVSELVSEGGVVWREGEAGSPRASLKRSDLWPVGVFSPPAAKFKKA